MGGVRTAAPRASRLSVHAISDPVRVVNVRVSRGAGLRHTVRIGAAVSKLPALAAEPSGHLRAGSMIAQDPG